MTTDSLFELEDYEETRTEWVILGDWDRCGLCGTRVRGMNQGGSLTGVVCDDCAQIDSCRIRDHEAFVVREHERNHTRALVVARCLFCAWWLNGDRWTGDRWVPLTVDEVVAAIAVHVRPRHTSHWGMSHEIADHDRLVAAQAKRRAAYLRAVA